MGDLVQIEKTRRRSASQLEGMLRCGESYRLERIAKAPQTPAAWLTQGIAFHEAIDKWESTGRVHDLDTMRTWYCEAWDEQHAKQVEQEPNLNVWLTGGRVKPQDDIERRFERGLQYVTDYHNWARETSHLWRVFDLGGDNLACEIPFDITLNGVRVVGYIDQIIEFPDGSKRLRDLKTGNKLPEPRQLGIYRVAAWETLGIDILEGDFYMCKNGEPTKPYDLSRYTPERVGKWFEDLNAMVEQERFIPSPGDHCRICAVYRYCDLKGRDAHLYPVGTRLETAA